jgi:hypothetical protein
VWLWYATGGPFPDYTQYCGNYTPPAYQCHFASSLDDCKAQVQEYLDAWYKDFNVIFTLTRPPSGDFYTVIITSGWPQCQDEVSQMTDLAASTEGGVAPNSYCNDSPGQTAIAIECGKNAHDCATIIAHEHGHLVGLVHTTSLTDFTDVMSPWVRSTAKGFDNAPLSTVVDKFNTCREGTQNSDQLMLSALGTWPGGTKPSPFPSGTDAGVSNAASPDAGDIATREVPDAPAIAGIIGPGLGPSVDGSVTILDGDDTYSRTPPQTLPDVGTATTTTNKGGCDFTRTPTSSSLLVAAALLFAYRLLSHRGRLSRSTATRRP